MRKTNCCVVVLFAIAIHVGYLADSLLAQRSYSGLGHSGSCAGGCNHGSGDDSLELIPYGPSAMQQNYQPPRSSQFYRGDEPWGSRNDYPQPSQYGPSFRSTYQAMPNSPYNGAGRRNYETRRDDFTYANDPVSEYATRGHDSDGPCRGGCSHNYRGGGRYSPRYDELNNQPARDQRGPNYGGEADQVPQLNSYETGLENRPRSYRPSLSRQSFPTRQEYLTPQQQGGVGLTSLPPNRPTGPPPESFDEANGSSDSGCNHAGCIHDHN